MKREYETGTEENVIFFYGFEIENTPARGMGTLFVVGLQDVETIKSNLRGSRHVYLGANQSFKFSSETITKWDKLIQQLLEDDLWVTWDIDSTDYPKMLDSFAILSGYRRFILQISLKLPYLDNLNYNACVKIDDTNFDYSNPGVWVHRLHSLKDANVFTSWDEYADDIIMEQDNAKG